MDADKPQRRRRLTPEERELRSELILARRVAGERMVEIAKEFHISTKTAYQALSEARRSGLIERARDHLQTRLLPLALAVYEYQLEHELNLEAARDVLQGLGLVGRQVKVQVEHDVKEDFDTWRLKRAAVIDIQPTPVDHDPSTDSSGPSSPGDAPDPDQPSPCLALAPAAAGPEPTDGVFGVDDGPVQD